MEKNRTEKKDHHQNSQKTSFYIQHLWTMAPPTQIRYDNSQSVHGCLGIEPIRRWFRTFSRSFPTVSQLRWQKRAKGQPISKGQKNSKSQNDRNLSGKNSDQKMGELIIQSPEKIESKNVGTVIKHLIQGISTPSLTHLLSLSGVPFLCCSILPNKKPS